MIEFHSTTAAGAKPIGMPEWPERAWNTASAERKRAAFTTECKGVLPEKGDGDRLRPQSGSRLDREEEERVESMEEFVQESSWCGRAVCALVGELGGNGILRVVLL